jgi:hypothetical protein
MTESIVKSFRADRTPVLPRALRPAPLVICGSDRKENDVCGLIQRIARFDAVIESASANPSDPDGSASGVLPGTRCRVGGPGHV